MKQELVENKSELAKFDPIKVQEEKLRLEQEAKQRVEREKQVAEEARRKALEEAENKRLADIARIEEKERKRIENKKHREKVEQEIYNALIDIMNASSEVSIVMEALKQNKIPHISINY